MNKYVTSSLIFVVGAGIGFGLSYVILKQKFEEKLEEEANKNEIYYNTAIKFEPIPVEEKDISESEETTKFVNNAFTEKMNRRKEELLKRERMAYDKIPHVFEEEAQEEVDEVELLVNNDQPHRDIHIITADQFAHEHLGYDKETLYWWRANNLLTTEDYDILDVPDLIGNEWQDRIGEFEPNVVYVRNETAETDYEIVEQKEDYYDYKE